MRITAAFAFLLFVCSINGNAQLLTGKPAVRFGLQAGAVHAAMNFNAAKQPLAKKEATAWGAGLQALFLIEVPLSQKLFVQPGYGILTTAYNRKDSGTTYHFAYLTMPLLLKYKLTEHLFIEGGAQFDLLISAKRKGAVAINITHDTEERNVGFTGGATYVVAKKFPLALRYTHGFNHIGLGQRSDVREYKSQQVSITAGFYF